MNRLSAFIVAFCLFIFIAEAWVLRDNGRYAFQGAKIAFAGYGGFCGGAGFKRDASLICQDCHIQHELISAECKFLKAFPGYTPESEWGRTDGRPTRIYALHKTRGLRISLWEKGIVLVTDDSGTPVEVLH